MSKAAELAALIGSGQAQGNKNLIINGAMTVDQRAQTTTANGYTVDRFHIGKFNVDELVIAVTQDTDNPSGNGFANSLKLAITTAESGIAADELFYYNTRLEGQNLQQLCYGTSSAKNLTLSFWVKSPLAGKHSVTFYQTTPARSNLQSYTVSSANTWEYKTITIDGDASGNIANDNSAELYVYWPLAGGSDYHGTPHTGWGAYSATDDFMFSDQVNLAGQTGNFFLTGIQLEVGDVATAFEHETYAATLQKCQRYFYRIGGNFETAATNTQVGRLASGVMTSTTASVLMRPNPVTMRDAPDITFDDAVSAYTLMTSRTTNAVTAVGDNQSTASTMAFGLTSGAASIDGDGAVLRSTRAQSTISISAEL